MGDKKDIEWVKIMGVSFLWVWRTIRGCDVFMKIRWFCQVIIVFRILWISIGMRSFRKWNLTLAICSEVNLAIWIYGILWWDSSLIILSHPYHWQDHDCILNIVILNHDKFCWGHGWVWWNMMKLETGWWFGCHFLNVPRNIGNVIIFLIIPIDELIFFRGVFPQPPTSEMVVQFGWIYESSGNHLPSGKLT